MDKDQKLEQERLKKKQERELRVKLMEASSGTTSSTDQVGKYMQKTQAQNAGKSIPDEFHTSFSSSKKRKAGSGFGNFDNW